MVSHRIPDKLAKGRTLAFVKTGAVIKDLNTDVLCLDLTENPVESLEKLSQEVFLPVLSNPKNQEGWGEVPTKEIMDKFHSFIANVSITSGHSRGKTCLPLPPMDGGGGSNALAKNRISVMEGAIVTWSKQIKNVLKQGFFHGP